MVKEKKKGLRSSPKISKSNVCPLFELKPKKKPSKSLSDTKKKTKSSIKSKVSLKKGKASVHSNNKISPLVARQKRINKLFQLKKGKDKVSVKKKTSNVLPSKKSKKTGSKVVISPVLNVKGGHSISNNLSNPLIPVKLDDEKKKEIISTAICGKREFHHANVTNPILGPVLFSPGDAPPPILEEHAEQKLQKMTSENALLQEAHHYFNRVKKKERKIRLLATRRLQMMKRINKEGGDKDGFKYVIPSSIDSVVKQLMSNGETDYTNVETSKLASQFGGDDIPSKSDRPMRHQNHRPKRFDDFYQFQTTEKWTKNVERFLLRGKYSKTIMAARQQRSIKNL